MRWILLCFIHCCHLLEYSRRSSEKELLLLSKSILQSLVVMATIITGSGGFKLSVPSSITLMQLLKELFILFAEGGGWQRVQDNGSRHFCYCIYK